MSAKINGKLAENNAERAVSFLRRLYPTKTAQHVEADTGINADTVRNWFDGSSPSFAHFGRLICAYGPDFLAAVLPERLGWLDAAARAQAQADLDARIAALQAERERLR